MIAGVSRSETLLCSRCLPLRLDTAFLQHDQIRCSSIVPLFTASCKVFAGERNPGVGAAFITPASGLHPAWISPERGRDECCPYTEPLTFRHFHCILSTK